MKKPLSLAVILNGPPNSGKDTLADRLTGYGFVKVAFKDQLYIETAEHFKVDYDEFVRRASDRELKEAAWSELELLPGEYFTPRSALIYTSEHLIKPNHGDDYFGKAAAKRCLELEGDFTVFSDGGFASELPPLTEVFEHVVIVRLHRNGCTFEGDSRAYLEWPLSFDLHLIDGKIELAVNYLFQKLGKTLLG